MRAATTTRHDLPSARVTDGRANRRHVHLGAHLRVPDPAPADLYLPTVERRRRTAALIAGLATCGVRPALLDSPVRSWMRLPSSTVHLHLHAAGELPHGLVAATATGSRLVVHLRSSTLAPQRSGADATLAARLLGAPTERWMLRRHHPPVSRPARRCPYPTGRDGGWSRSDRWSPAVAARRSSRYSPPCPPMCSWC